MAKKLAFLAVGLAMVAGPSLAMAQTASPNDISALLARLHDLQARLVQIKLANPQSYAPAAAPGGTSCVNLSHNMGPRSTDAATGGDVTKLQTYLVANGYMIDPGSGNYGTYGAKTFSAVGKFQLTKGIVNSTNSNVYGFTGPKTRGAVACGGQGSLSALPPSGPAPLTVTFSNMAGGPLPAPLMINYGDGSSETAAACVAGNPMVADKCTTPGINTHTYTSPGSYLASLTSGGQTLGSATIVVTSSNNSGPTAVIDPRSLSTSTPNPTINGTAKNINPISITVSQVSSTGSTQVFNSNNVPVVNGKWSVQITPPIAVGSYYVSMTTGSDVPLQLAQGTLTVSAANNLPQPPSSLSASCDATGTASLTWSAVPGVDSYMPIIYVPAGQMCPAGWTDGGLSSQNQYEECYIANYTGTGAQAFSLPPTTFLPYVAYVYSHNSFGLSAVATGPQNFSCQASIAPTATIDAASLTTSSSMPTIMGTAQNTSAVSYVILPILPGNVLFSSGVLPVTSGAWSGTVTTPLANGTYTVSVHDESVNQGQLLTTGTLNVNAVSSGPVITASPPTLAAGATTTVTWSGIVFPTANDWIGFYPVGTTNYYSSISWRYVSCKVTPSTAMASGSCAYPIAASVAPGNYKFVLFGNNSYVPIATSPAVTISAAGAPAASLTVAVNGSTPSSEITVDPGQSLTYVWNGTNVVSASSNYTADSADYCPNSSSSGTSDTFSFQISTRSGATTTRPVSPCRAGHTYTVNYNVTGANGQTAKASVIIHVTTTGATAISVAPTTATHGTSVTVSWSNVPNPNGNEWMGLYKAGDPYDSSHYISYLYTASCGYLPKTSSTAAGSCPFILPSTLAAGNYTFGLFRNSGYNLIATSNTLTVQ